MSADDASTYCPARDDAEGWLNEAFAARAALYLLKVATARPDLPRVCAWERELKQIHSIMARPDLPRMCDEQWDSWDWRRNTLTIATHYRDPRRPDVEEESTTRFRARVMALLDDM